MGPDHRKHTEQIFLAKIYHNLMPTYVFLNVNQEKNLTAENARLMEKVNYSRSSVV